MSEIIKAIVLGFVQGATEFIPISSSGHLVVVPWLLGWEASSLLFDTVLHWGTLLAILIIFWRDFWEMGVAALGSIFKFSLANPRARLAWAIVFGSIPAAVGGLLFEDFLEQLFASPLAAGFFLLVTALLLAGSEWLTERQRLRFGQAASREAAQEAEPEDETIEIAVGVGEGVLVAEGVPTSSQPVSAEPVETWESTEPEASTPPNKPSFDKPSLDHLTFGDAGIIGLAQALALAPGISRSGSTIAAGLVRGLRRDDAARFSFLLGTPAFFGAGLLQLIEAIAADAGEVAMQMPALVTGFVVSAVTGFAAIRFLLRFLRNNNLYIFAVYCLAAGVFVITLSFFL